MYWNYVIFGSFAVGYYLWDFIKGYWQRDSYLKRISLLEEEMGMVRDTHQARMRLEFTEAKWQH
jgi:hypothetical protein